MSVNYNSNTNINNNYNNYGNMGNRQRFPQDPISILPTYYRIITNNGLTVIDDDGIVRQVSENPLEGIDLWDIVEIEGLYAIKNIGTERFMAIGNSLGLPGTSVITIPQIIDISGTWLMNTVTPPGTIPPSPDFTVFRTIRSLHPIVVPEDSAEPGMALLVGTFGLDPGKRFTIV